VQLNPIKKTMDKIQMLNAGYGDTLIISVNSEHEGDIHFLIDCGFGFNEEIKPRLEKLDKIKRFIITHYDRDHIESAYKFLKENGNSQKVNIIEIEQIWHNTFRHIQFNKCSNMILTDVDNILIESYVSGHKSEITDNETEEDIGAKQAINVGSKIIENEYSWNQDFNKEAAIIENRQKIKITDDVSIILLSPNKEKLEVLEKEFKKEIYNLLGKLEIPQNKIFDDAYEWFVKRKDFDKMKKTEENISSQGTNLTIDNVIELSNQNLYKPDPSEANGSSIAFILKTANKSILLLGDAHSEIIEYELKKLYPKCIEKPILFDAIKISHHGSQGNSSPDLLKIIDSGKFLISTNSNHPNGHKHPDLETIARIVNRSTIVSNAKRILYFNYDLGHIKGFENESLKEYFKYDILVQNNIEL
jgi:beta-lactamase superfamily II metal-dependent hydrolase